MWWRFGDDVELDGGAVVREDTSGFLFDGEVGEISHLLVEEVFGFSLKGGGFLEFSPSICFVGILFATSKWDPLRAPSRSGREGMMIAESGSGWGEIQHDATRGERKRNSPVGVPQVSASFLLLVVVPSSELFLHRATILVLVVLSLPFSGQFSIDELKSLSFTLLDATFPLKRNEPRR